MQATGSIDVQNDQELGVDFESMLDNPAFVRLFALLDIQDHEEKLRVIRKAFETVEELHEIDDHRRAREQDMVQRMVQELAG